jgi:aspartate aminotransferase-like enzyme
MTETAGPLLMTPGPTRIPERVLRAGHRVLHHRTPAFSDAVAECLELLRGVFGTTSADVLPVHGTGRAAMEGAVLNFFRPGDAVVACCNGRFGEMWARFAEIHGLRLDRFLDMFRTGNNVLGSLTCAAVLAKLDGEEIRA